MDSAPINCTEDLPFERNKEIIKAILESGHSVELPATGYSMYPELRPGDRVIVQPLYKDEIPKPGQVVVYEYNNAFVMHRLIEIINGYSGELLFVTRGDCGMKSDKLWPQKQFVGVASGYKRNGKEHSVKSYIPGIRRYKLNRMLFWFYNKLK